ncbi:MAG: methyltransferase domain-containing protein [Pyrinomonadaceae bacterium]
MYYQAGRWDVRAPAALESDSLITSVFTSLRMTPVDKSRNPVNLGDLRRVSPISRVHGTDRGSPIDRYYIERFLSANASDIKGRVLEFDDDAYTRRFGGDRVSASDVLHVEAGHPGATITADLADAAHVPDETFDCVICTQTLMYIYEVRVAVKTLYRILKPGGVVLATFPGISQISRYDMDRWGEYWRFTILSAKRLFAEAFPPKNVAAEAQGNVLSAAAFLYGMCAEELRPEELDHQDPDYEVLLAVRARKPASAGGGAAA